MNSRPCQFILLWSWIFLNWILSSNLLAQGSTCQPPSEHTLNQLLQQIISNTQIQGLQIGGIVHGFFSKKDQVDYIFWLNEQAPVRKIVKLVCQDAEWKMTTIGTLPKGVTLSKDNFKDVTGDEVLELLYHYSYHKEHCIDGCTILSFKGEKIDVLYHKEEKQSCQQIDWSSYQNNSELPFISYQLQQPKNETKKKVLVQRFVKRYQGGLNQTEVLEKANLDSSATVLIYDNGSNHFIEPKTIPCHSKAFLKNKLDPAHPAVLLANQSLNKNPAHPFQIEGVYSANFSNPKQVDYLFYSNTFEQTSKNTLRRKAVKITCNGETWVVTGILYVGANFSAQHIQDVNGDGIHEVIDEHVQSEENGCIKTYRILSFAERVGQLLYMHKNRYAFCQPYGLLHSSSQDGDPIGVEYQVNFEDLDNDGLKELIQQSNGHRVIFTYNTAQKRYTIQR